MSNNLDELPDSPKMRHKYLTALLWWLLFANMLVAIASPFLLPTIRKNDTPEFVMWVAWPIALLGAIRVACVVVLFRWKKWGFYGYAVATLAEASLNVSSGVEIEKTPLWFIGTAILLWVLQLGRPKSGWSQLG